MPQVLHTVAAAGNGLLLLSAVDIVEGADGVVALAVGLQIAALVTVPQIRLASFVLSKILTGPSRPHPP